MKKNKLRFATRSSIVIFAVHSMFTLAQDRLTDPLEVDLDDGGIGAEVERPLPSLEIPLAVSSSGAGLSQDTALASSPAPLADRLAEELGITPDQGAAGAGSIFRYAQQKMSADDFKKIHDLIPGMDHILSAGPLANDSDFPANPEETKSMTPELGTRLLKNEFDQFGLAPDMVQQFVPVIVEYVKSRGGEPVANLLRNALQGI